jgi:hypothetical protein
MTTHFQDFTRDNGQPVTVEWRVASEGESNFDHPGHICDGGGSEPIIEIVDAWPTSTAHNWLHNADYRLWHRLHFKGWRMAAYRVLRLPIRAAIAVDAWWRASLTDAERERMESWLAERYEPEPYDPADDY